MAGVVRGVVRSGVGREWGKLQVASSVAKSQSHPYYTSRILAGASNKQELNAMLTNTIMIRRRKEDVLSQLPSKGRVDVWLEVPPADLQVRQCMGGGAYGCMPVRVNGDLAACEWAGGRGVCVWVPQCVPIIH